MKRSLAAELADLADPAPKDLDNDGLDDGPALLDPHEDLGIGKPNKRHKIAKEAMRIRAPVHLENPVYKGKQISSNIAFKSFSPEDDLSSDSRSSVPDTDDEQSDTGIGSDDSQTSSEEVTRGFKRNNGLSGDSGHDTKAARGASFSSGLDVESGSSDSEVHELNGYAEGLKISNGWPKMNGTLSKHAQRINTASESDENPPVEEEQITSADEGGNSGEEVTTSDDEEAVLQADAQALINMKSRLAKDKERAQAVKNQQAVWDRLLELRILEQNCLTASYTLPDPSNHVKHISGLTALRMELDSALQDLVDLHSALIKQNSEIKARVQLQNLHPDPNKDITWEDLDSVYQELGAFRNSSLDRWYRKTILASGATALKNGLRVFNQSISSQVASSLQLSEKRILAAHLPKSEASRKIFSAGQPQEERGNEHDLESYNDSQFYQQLLKEFLETKGITASQGANTTKHRKIKNTRDRRASKGRRLRYDVQDKLVNFMAAVNYEEPPMASQLFRNLFGQRLS